MTAVKDIKEIDGKKCRNALDLERLLMNACGETTIKSHTPTPQDKAEKICIVFDDQQACVVD